MAALAVSWLAAAGGPARAACPFYQSQPISHLFDTRFDCPDGQPARFFTGLIANPTGVNNNGQDGVCESGPPAVNGIGQVCNPGAGVIGDGQVVVQYDFGVFNQSSLGCPSLSGGPQGGSPIVVMVVAPNGSFAIVRTGYDVNFAGYMVDFAFPLNEAGDHPLNAACSFQGGIVITSIDGVQICGRVEPPLLLSDCNADTAGPIAGTCPGPAGNPAITPGRIFTRSAPCGSAPDIRLGSGWTPSAEPPNPTTGAFCIPQPRPDCGRCSYLAATYRFDGMEIPAVAGFTYLSGLPVCFDRDRDGFDDCSECDDCNPAIHPGAPEVCNGLDDNCNGAVDEGQGTPDSDQDGVADFCDNCPLYANGLQTDSDNDHLGDACDNCQLTANLDQSDSDADWHGDACDPDDGLIMVDVPDELSVAWQGETAFTTFNLYRGDLAVLKAGGGSTQDPALVPLAGKTCDIAGDDAADSVALQPGEAVFYLVTGNGAAGESSLGTDSQGVPRANAHPCP